MTDPEASFFMAKMSAHGIELEFKDGAFRVDHQCEVHRKRGPVEQEEFSRERLAEMVPILRFYGYEVIDPKVEYDHITAELRAI